MNAYGSTGSKQHLKILKMGGGGGGGLSVDLPFTETLLGTGNKWRVGQYIYISRLFPDASLVRASARESRSATQVAPLEISDS